jgi:hypothetical protein
MELLIAPSVDAGTYSSAPAASTCQTCLLGYYSGEGLRPAWLVDLDRSLYLALSAASAMQEDILMLPLPRPAILANKDISQLRGLQVALLAVLEDFQRFERPPPACHAILALSPILVLILLS